MEHASERFKINEKDGKVEDLYSGRNFRLANLPEEYLSVRYEAGFIQPAAYLDHRIVLEEAGAGHLSATEIMEEDEALAKMLPLLMALSWMHERGMVYGNLSPEAIIDTEDGYCIDCFGIGEIPSQRNDYSAYEYYAYQGRGCPASDIYSVGVILYELLSGIHIGNAEARADLQEELEPLVAFGVSDRTQDAVMKALNVFADDRYESMPALMEALYPEKQVDDFRNDHKIRMRKIRTEDENIEEKLSRSVSVPEDEEEGEKEYVEDEPVRNKNKAYAVAGIISCAVLLAGIAIMAFMPKQGEEKKEIRQMKTEAVAVRDIVPDYGEAGPTGDAALKDMSHVLFSEAERIAKLEGFAVKRKDAESDSIEKDHVISQSVEGRTVIFAVSKGTSEPVVAAETKAPPARATANRRLVRKPQGTKKPRRTSKPTKKPEKKPEPQSTRRPTKAPDAGEAKRTGRPRPTKRPLTLDDGGDFTLK